MKNVLKAIRFSAFLFGALFIISSCTSHDKNANENTVETTQPAPTATSTSSEQPKLTDAEIASIAVTANQIDVDYAKIALEKTTNPEVKNFATTMLKDHQSVIDQAVALATKLGVTPKDNPTTQSLLSDASNVKTSFKSKTGSEFDKAYVNNEVSYHKAAITLVENTLIQDATNAELKDLLKSALPIFKEHLNHAEMVQKDLNK